MTNIDIENLILSSLINDENYIRASIPYIKEDYFVNFDQRTIFNTIKNYFDKYNMAPTSSAIKIELDEANINQDTYENCLKTLKIIDSKNEVDFEWLIHQTEKYCQDKAVYNAIMESIQIIDNKSNNDKGAIPQILQDALAVSFDNHIGHDFLEDFEERYDFYHEVVERLPFDLEYMNEITRGGVPRKTLNIILAGTGVGKTLMMCHFAASNLMQGKNVLYITLEMAEERIAERIDSNLMNVALNDLETLPKDSYSKKLNLVQKKTNGKLIVKTSPPSRERIVVSKAKARPFKDWLNK